MPENNETAPLPLPEAKDVRWWWVKGRAKGTPKAPSEDQFDRWLEARDRENRAIGWDAANEVTEDYWREGGIGRPYPNNPYRGDKQ